MADHLQRLDVTRVARITEDELIAAFVASEQLGHDEAALRMAAFIKAYRALQTATRQAGAPRGVLVVEESGFVQRFGQTAPERIEQRRAAWQALATDVGMAVLAVRAGVPVEPSATALRRQLDGAPAA